MAHLWTANSKPARWVAAIAAAVFAWSTASVACAAPKPNPGAAQKLAEEGKALWLARAYEAAADKFAEAVRRFEHPDLVFTHARCLEQTGQFKAASVGYKQAAALLKAGAERQVIDARAVANAKLDEAQQYLNDGQANLGLPLANAAHRVLYGHAKRADDGQTYPEASAVLLLVARLELAAGSREAAERLLADVRADPTAPDKVLERARALSRQDLAPKPERRETASPPPSLPETAKAPTPAPPPIVVAKPETAPPPKPVPEVVKPPEPRLPLPTARESANALEPAPKPIVQPPTQAKAVVTAQPPAMERSRPLGAKVLLAVGGTLAVGGGLLYLVGISEVSTLQSKITAAGSGKVEGLSQREYVKQKEALELTQGAMSATAIVGCLAAAAGVVWFVAGKPNERITLDGVGVMPTAGGAVAVVAWGAL